MYHTLARPALRRWLVFGVEVLAMARDGTPRHPSRPELIQSLVDAHVPPETIPVTIAALDKLTQHRLSIALTNTGAFVITLAAAFDDVSGTVHQFFYHHVQLASTPGLTEVFVAAWPTLPRVITLLPTLEQSLPGVVQYHIALHDQATGQPIGTCRVILRRSVDRDAVDIRVDPAPGTAADFMGPRERATFMGVVLTDILASMHRTRIYQEYQHELQRVTTAAQIAAAIQERDARAEPPVPTLATMPNPDKESWDALWEWWFGVGNKVLKTYTRLWKRLEA